MSSTGGVKMQSIEEEMSRFEEEIMSLTQDPTPIGGAAPNQESNQKGPSFQFQPRQTQGRGGEGGGGEGRGVPRAPGFQPRQMGRAGGNMPQRPNRPTGGHQGFVPHQVRVNQRPHGPPRFPHLPPPPPPPPMNSGGPMGPMPGMGPPPPNMMGPLPPPPMPPFAMMPPGPPPMNAQKPVTLSAKPTTYASKPVLNKKTKKKVKKEKSAESKDQSISEEKEAKSVEEPPAPPPVAPGPPAPPAMPHPTHQLNAPVRPPMSLPPPPAIPQAFVPAPTAADLAQITQGGAYELGTASEPLKKKEKKKKHMRVAAGTTWEDDSLSEWDPNDFRLFAGDLGNEVTEDTLSKVFGSYPSFLKCKIIRDKRTNKTKGYGFVSFKDPRDFVQAMKDWNGKYVGNRPIKLLKSTWKDRDISSVKKKQKEKDRLGLR